MNNGYVHLQILLRVIKRRRGIPINGVGSHEFQLGSDKEIVDDIIMLIEMRLADLGMSISIDSHGDYYYDYKLNET